MVENLVFETGLAFAREPANVFANPAEKCLNAFSEIVQAVWDNNPNRAAEA